MRDLLLSVFSHRFLAIGRWEIGLVMLRLKSRFWRQDQKIQDFLSTRESPRFLNLGSGPRGKEEPNWVNIDGVKDSGVHFRCDFGQRLPFPDESFAGVFCEHVMEHFTLEEGEAIAKEVCRILERDGVFRVIVPDAEKIVRSYLQEPDELMNWRGGEFETPMEVVNEYFRQRYEHQFLYDWVTMRKMLERAGFQACELVSFSSTKWKEPLVIDDPKYKWESLYVEARK